MNWYNEVDFIVQRDPMVYPAETGDRVVEIQQLLNAQGYGLTLDGDYGPATQRAVRDFQDRHGVIPDGIVGPKTLSILKNLPANPKFLSRRDIQRGANLLEVPFAAMMALVEVESKGRGFLDNDSRAVILYERHIFYQRLKNYPQIRRDELALEQPNIVNAHTGGYKGGSSEYDRLAKAKAIQPQTALESASWGLGQVMGFHWQRLGYNSVEHYVSCMQNSEGDQLEAVCRFIQADPKLLEAMRTQDFKTFALIYNGKEGVNRGYHIKMDDAFARHSVELTADGIPV